MGVSNSRIQSRETHGQNSITISQDYHSLVFPTRDIIGQHIIVSDKRSWIGYILNDDHFGSL
jgi:hypothetical protein